jgi:6,7-dimethyl-8-ribityllumazine synthase
MTSLEGTLKVQGRRFAIVVSRYNELITNRLLEGAIQTLKRHGASDEQIEVAYVPGAWEIPVAAARYARSTEWDAVICLGAVLQGETSHAHHISASVCSALMSLALETGKPITLGVLTDATFEQALERASGKMGNKGSEAALSAIEMVNVLK